METIWIALLGSSALATLIAGVFEMLRFRRERNAKKEDDAEQNIVNRLDVIETQMKVQNEALKHLLYDRILHLGQKYILEGSIGFEERRALNNMHNVYHKGLDANGDLDILMNEVNSLPLKKENNI